jgi:hypothetical protein
MAVPSIINFPIQTHGVNAKESAHGKRIHTILVTVKPGGGTPTIFILLGSGVRVEVFTVAASAHPMATRRKAIIHSSCDMLADGRNKLSNPFERLLDRLGNRQNNFSEGE